MQRHARLEQTTFDVLVDRARRLVVPGRRTILGITGAPGAGKSTIARIVVQTLGDDAVLVGMDGFHLADETLRRSGLHTTKGAIDTFDAHGYVTALDRLRAAEDPVVYLPRFDRGLEAAVAGAVAVPRTVPLVVTEGNYLLADVPPWRRVRSLLDECWFVEVDDDVRLRRLVRRHEAYGRSPEEARERGHGPDQRNAELIARTRTRADLVMSVRSYDHLDPRS